MNAVLTHFQSAGRQVSGVSAKGIGLLLLAIVSLTAAMPGYALDLVAFTGLDGPLLSAIQQLNALGPAVKALVGFIAFVVALISLAALRNFAPVLFFIGVAIFAATGLVIAGAIMSAPLAMLA